MTEQIVSERPVLSERDSYGTLVVHYSALCGISLAETFRRISSLTGNSTNGLSMRYRNRPDEPWIHNDSLLDLIRAYWDPCYFINGTRDAVMFQEQNQYLNERVNELHKEIHHQKELQRKRQSTPQAKETRRKRDEAKKQAANDPYVRLAKLDILAEEGATEGERENARSMASELRGRLMGNAA